MTALGDKIAINDVNVTLTDAGHVDANHGLTFERFDEHFYLDAGQLRIKWDMNHKVVVTVDKYTTFNTNVRGLCGDYNGEPLGEAFVVIKLWLFDGDVVI